MKSAKIALAFLLVFACVSSAQVLVSLGSSGFTVDPQSLTPYSQTATTLTFNTPVTTGDNIYGVWNTTYNWSSYITFGLQFSVSGTNPNLPASVYFYDTNYNVINTYSLTTNGVGSTQTVVPLTLFAAGTGNLSAVAGFQLNWDGGGTVNATFTNVVAVPEPSTWVLLAGGLMTIVVLRPHHTRGTA